MMKKIKEYVVNNWRPMVIGLAIGVIITAIIC